jgi:hypothetical protein
MTEPMTLEEAVRVMSRQDSIPLSDTTAHPSLAGWFRERTQAIATLLAHAERTVEARSGEPSIVDLARAIAASDDGAHLMRDELVELLAAIDTLTAERDRNNGSPKAGDMIARNPENHADQWLVAAKYFAENLEPAERTIATRSGEPEAVKRLREAPVWHLVTDYIDTLTAELAAAREELDRERMRLAACGVVANANTPQTAAAARAFPDEYRSASCDDVARIVDSEMQLRADRDRLAACVERVRGVSRFDVADSDGAYEQAEIPDARGRYMKAADILAALEGTDG